MNTTGIEAFLNQYIVWIVPVLALFCLVLLIWLIVLQSKYKKIYRKLDFFMRGEDAESLESIIRKNMKDIDEIKRIVKGQKIDISTLRRQFSRSCSKMGIIKYNGFIGMGGNSSFALTLLDNNNSGIILNVIHSREGSYSYVKEVTGGICESQMSQEEMASLEMAMRSK